MPLTNDGDIIRGLGFVTLYAAYLEEQVDDLLLMLAPLEAFPDAERRWRISRKVEKALRLVQLLDFDYRDGLLEDLRRLKDLFEWRNEIVHGRIYGNFGRPDTLVPGRPNVLEREVAPDELYDLANTLDNASQSLLRPMIFQIPRALRGDT